MKKAVSLIIALLTVLSVFMFTANAKIDNKGNWSPANSEWDALPTDGVVARFAVGTDIHFPDCNSRGKLSYLYKTLEKIGAVDALLISGDITSEGAPSEYKGLMELINENTEKNPINPEASGSAVGTTVLSLGNNDLSPGKTADFIKYTGQQPDALCWIKGIPIISISPDEYVPKRESADMRVGNNYDLSADFLRSAYKEIDDSGYKGLIIMIAHHRPSNEGTENAHWSGEMIDMMKAHPNTVIFTGHSHTWIWPVDEFILQDAGFTHVRSGSIGPEGGMSSAKINQTEGRANDLRVLEGDYDSTFTLVDIMEDGSARLRRIDNAKGEIMHGGEYLTVRPDVLTDHLVNTEDEEFPKSYGAGAGDPRFPDGAKVTVEDRGNNSSVRVTFPEAIPASPLSRDAIVEYRIRFKNESTGEYLNFGERSFVRVGNYRLADDVGKPWNVIVHGLNSGTDYSVEVRAYGCFGIETVAICSDTTVSVTAPEPVYTATPVIDFDYSYGSVADGAGHTLTKNTFGI